MLFEEQVVELVRGFAEQVALAVGVVQEVAVLDGQALCSGHAVPEVWEQVSLASFH